MRGQMHANETDANINEKVYTKEEERKIKGSETQQSKSHRSRKTLQNDAGELTGNMTTTAAADSLTDQEDPEKWENPRDEAIENLITAVNDEPVTKSLKPGTRVFKICAYPTCEIEDENMEQSYAKYMVQIHSAIVQPRTDNTPKRKDRVQYLEDEEGDCCDEPRNELYLSEKEANVALLRMLKNLDPTIANSIVKSIEEIEKLTLLDLDQKKISEPVENLQKIPEIELLRKQNMKEAQAVMEDLFKDIDSTLVPKPKEKNILQTTTIKRSIRESTRIQEKVKKQKIDESSI